MRYSDTVTTRLWLETLYFTDYILRTTTTITTASVYVSVCLFVCEGHDVYVFQTSGKIDKYSAVIIFFILVYFM